RPATTPLLPKSNRHYQTIHRPGAMPRIQHQQGIDVNLLHRTAQVEAELREFAQHLRNGAKVSRFLPTGALEYRGAFEGIHHLTCFVGIEWWHTQYSVVQHLDKNAPQTEDDARTKLRVTRHADDGLAPTLYHLLYRHPVQLGLCIILARVVQDALKRHSRLVRLCHI